MRPRGRACRLLSAARPGRLGFDLLLVLLPFVSRSSSNSSSRVCLCFEAFVAVVSWACALLLSAAAVCPCCCSAWGVCCSWCLSPPVEAFEALERQTRASGFSLCPCHSAANVLGGPPSPSSSSSGEALGALSPSRAPTAARLGAREAPAAAVSSGVPLTSGAVCRRGAPPDCTFGMYAYIYIYLS